MVQEPVLAELLALAAGSGARLRRVVNAGAGEGLYTPRLLALPGLEMLIELDLSVLPGLDPADPRRRWLAASITRLPLADASVDLLLASEVLEHVVDDRRAIAEIRRVLAPHGWALVTVPTPPAVPDPAHVREGYAPRELTALLASEGLAPVAVRFAMHAFFRAVLAHWREGATPRWLIRALARLDRRLPLGPAMDLLILARVERRAATVRSPLPPAPADAAHR